MFLFLQQDQIANRPQPRKARSAHRPGNPRPLAKRDTLQILGRNCDPEPVQQSSTIFLKNKGRVRFSMLLPKCSTGDKDLFGDQVLRCHRSTPLLQEPLKRAAKRMDVTSSSQTTQFELL
ncbi:hypothetical protein TNCV_4640951 [Trichonephila clavipes]|nr:hypothetical protein TNCV_4640951 [Trichonephila clavipes]